MTRRNISEEEKSFWRQIMEDVKQLDKTDREKSLPPIKKHPIKVRRHVLEGHHVFEQNEQKSWKAVPVGQLSSKTKKNFSPQARIDLHGFTTNDADKILLRFALRCQLQNIKHVLIITGKGSPGILRPFVEQWFSNHPELIVGFTTAQSHHGGEGAYYVHIRRLKD